MQTHLRVSYNKEYKEPSDCSLKKISVCWGSTFFYTASWLCEMTQEPASSDLPTFVISRITAIEFWPMKWMFFLVWPSAFLKWQTAFLKCQSCCYLCICVAQVGNSDNEITEMTVIHSPHAYSFKQYVESAFSSLIRVGSVVIYKKEFFIQSWQRGLLRTWEKHSSVQTINSLRAASVILQTHAAHCFPRRAVTQQHKHWALG